MKTITINIKILLLIAVTSVVTMVLVMVFASYSLKNIIDTKQKWIYTEKIDTILDMLNRKSELLEKTFLAEAYEDGFKQSFLTDFRAAYYAEHTSKSYPFIYSRTGHVIAHPIFDYGCRPRIGNMIFDKIIELKNGEMDYVYNGQKKWMIFRYFEKWDWIVGYVVAHTIKYDSFHQFRNILFLIMIGTFLLALAVITFLITRLTKPIYTLTKASGALAEGNLDYPIEVNTKDELGVLAKTFMYMRNAIQEKMLDLQSQNTALEYEISERKRISDALAESEKRYRILVENTNDLIVKFDENKRLLFVSPSYCAIFNKKEDELIGNSFIPFIHKDDQKKVEKSIETLFAPPYCCYHEERALTRDGWQWLAWSNKGLPDESGKVTEIIAVGRNITDRKQAENEREKLITDLEQKNAEMECFTYSVSHDLKSPLITVIGFTNFIKKRLMEKDYGDVPEYADRILNAAERMHRLLDDLLNLSRVGRVVKPPENFSFKELAYEAKELLTQRIEENGIQLNIAEDLPDVFADKQRLLEVLINLIENAIKFTSGKKSPEISVGVRQEHAQYIFYVKDNGIGIEPQYKQRIFGLFEKLDANSVGTGVGLALVKRIIEYHHGKVWVESDGKDKGSTFFFTLPIDPVK
ncbi:MAG: ATP-binding protein [Candidatus Auribacterota bacterium]|nr:ATP-binding protein [Candidatus Auribacterota bacterium]